MLKSILKYISLFSEVATDKRSHLSSSAKSIQGEGRENLETKEPSSKRILLNEVVLSQPAVTLDLAQGFGTASDETVGQGFENSNVDTFVDYIVQKVIEKTNPESSTSAQYVSPSALQPTLSEPEVLLIKSQSNDSYDEQKLIDSLPKQAKKQAAKLLKQINENAQHITFNSSGNLFIDGISIPETNFFDLFPLLFKKKLAKEKITDGLLALFKKIQELNLSPLISLQLSLSNSQNLTQTSTRAPQLPPNFWYIGP